MILTAFIFIFNTGVLYPDLPLKESIDTVLEEDTTDAMTDQAKTLEKAKEDFEKECNKESLDTNCVSCIGNVETGFSCHGKEPDECGSPGCVEYQAARDSVYGNVGASEAALVQCEFEINSSYLKRKLKCTSIRSMFLKTAKMLLTIVPTALGMLNKNTETTDTSGDGAGGDNSDLPPETIYEDDPETTEDDTRGTGGEELCLNDENKTKCYCESAGYTYIDKTKECSELGLDDDVDTTSSDNLSNKNKKNHSGGGGAGISSRGAGGSKNTKKPNGHNDNATDLNDLDENLDLNKTVSTSTIAGNSLLSRAYRRKSKYQKKSSKKKISSKDVNLFDGIHKTYLNKYKEQELQ